MIIKVDLLHKISTQNNEVEKLTVELCTLKQELLGALAVVGIIFFLEYSFKGIRQAARCLGSIVWVLNKLTCYVFNGYIMTFAILYSKLLQFIFLNKNEKIMLGGWVYFFLRLHFPFEVEIAYLNKSLYSLAWFIISILEYCIPTGLTNSEMLQDKTVNADAKSTYYFISLIFDCLLKSFFRG